MKLWLPFAVIGGALAITPAHAADSRMQACTAQWQQLGLSRAEYRPFLVKCLKGETRAAKTTVSPQLLMAKPRPMQPKATRAGKHPQANRMKQCGAQWRQAKAAGTTGGQTWRQFASSCLKKN